MNYCEKTICQNLTQRRRDKTYNMYSKNDIKYK